MTTSPTATQTLVDLIKKIDPKGAHPEKVAAQLSALHGGTTETHAQAFLESAKGHALQACSEHEKLTQLSMDATVAMRKYGADDPRAVAAIAAYDEIAERAEGFTKRIDDVADFFDPKKYQNAPEAKGFFEHLIGEFSKHHHPKGLAVDLLDALHDAMEDGTLVHDAAAHAEHVPLNEHIAAVRKQVAALAEEHAATLPDKAHKDAFLKHAGALDGLAEQYYITLKGIIPPKNNAAEVGNVFVANAGKVAKHLLDSLEDSVVMEGKHVAKEAGLHEHHFKTATLIGLQDVKFEAETAKTAGEKLFNTVAELYGDMKHVLGDVSHTKAGAVGGVLLAGGLLCRSSEKDEKGEKHQKFGIISTTFTGLGVTLLTTTAFARLGHGRMQEVAQKALNTTLGWAGSLSR